MTFPNDLCCRGLNKQNKNSRSEFIDSLSDGFIWFVSELINAINVEWVVFFSYYPTPTVETLNTCMCFHVLIHGIKTLSCYFFVLYSDPTLVIDVGQRQPRRYSSRTISRTIVTFRRLPRHGYSTPFAGVMPDEKDRHARLPIGRLTGLARLTDLDGVRKNHQAAEIH